MTLASSCAVCTQQAFQAQLRGEMLGEAGYDGQVERLKDQIFKQQVTVSVSHGVTDEGAGPKKHRKAFP